MKITAFVSKLALKEGKKVSVNIAQTAEIIKLANKLTDGALYKKIREIPEDEELF